MSIEKAKAWLAKYGLEDRVLEFEVSSATVELAAAAAGCEPARIAKSLSFLADGKAILAQFGTKAKMLSHDQVSAMVGHGVGGVCPFGINEGVAVYLDSSLRRFTTVFPACGSSNSAVALTIPELEQCSNYSQWVDVCKGWTA